MAAPSGRILGAVVPIDASFGNQEICPKQRLDLEGLSAAAVLMAAVVTKASACIGCTGYEKKYLL